MNASNRLRRIAGVVICLSVLLRASGEYPFTQTFDATAKSDTAAVSSRVTIHVDRLMEETRRKKAMDALKYTGYAGFLNVLRALPDIGTIELRSRKVSIRYAHEQQTSTGRRMVLVADKPLFFLGGDRAKAQAGYELTMVELLFDSDGAVTGRMAGAARVKPSPDGIVLDDYAGAPVRLAAHANPPSDRDDHDR